MSRSFNPDSIAYEFGPQWLFLLRRMGTLWPAMRPMAQDQSEALKRACGLSESPIEIRLIAGMLSHNWGKPDKPIALNVTRDFQAFVGGSDKAVLMPQCEFGKYRFDFALCIRRVGVPIFCAIEADGAAFHNKARDADRDAWCEGMGIKTYRFSGSEINRDTSACSAWLDKVLRKREGF